MYRDNSLIPSEAIRLLALGLLAERPRAHAEVALEVRHFTGLMVGPSLDLVAPPLELLKIEGLVVEAVEKDAALSLTTTGQAELAKLLASNLRAPTNDISKLILGLKLRFFELLPPAEQRLQADILVEVLKRERARLAELARDHAEESTFAAWLALERTQVEQRLAWFQRLHDSLQNPSG